MSMQYIRDYYGVPAKRGQRIKYTGSDIPGYGTITSALNSRIRVRMDDVEIFGTLPLILHPTWEVEYLKDES